MEYRGLTKNNEWVYGSFITRSGRWGFHYFILELSGDLEEEDIEHSVDYRNVGQFTGFYDKHKTKIYEGDIINPGMGEIFFDPRFAQFRVKWHDAIFKRVRGSNPSYNNGEPLFGNSEIAWTVIGNIHQKEKIGLLNNPIDNKSSADSLDLDLNNDINSYNDTLDDK